MIKTNDTTAARVSDAAFLLTSAMNVLDYAFSMLTPDQKETIEKTEEFLRDGFSDLIEFRNAVEVSIYPLQEDVKSIDHVVEFVTERCDPLDPGVDNQITAEVLREMGAI